MLAGYRQTFRPVGALSASLLFTAVLGLSACQGKPPAAAQNADAPAPPTSASMRFPAHVDGFVGVRFGMDDASFRRNWQGALQGTSKPTGCYYLSPSVKENVGLAFGFFDGKFVRYDVVNDNIAAPGGGGVGMSLQEVRAKYPQAVTGKSPAGMQSLRVENAQHDVMVFDADSRGQVIEWRVGVQPYIDNMGGCG